jgi:hypothetical protein
MTIDDITAAYTDEQRAAIEVRSADCVDDDWVSYQHGSELNTKGTQAFVSFGGTIAYEVFTKRIDIDGTILEVCPAVTKDGNFVRQVPDEGRAGVLHLLRLLSQGGVMVEDPAWTADFMRTGWLYTKELDMTPSEIAGRIAAEIDAGGTPLTGFNDHEAYR